MHSAAFLLITCTFLPGDTEAPPDEFAERVRPILERSCFECHGDDAPEADLSFERFMSHAQAAPERDLWERVRRRLADGSMPPEEAAARPTPEELALLLGWLDERVSAPAHATLRRLNRTEYRYAVLDLLGVDYAAAHFLPADGIGGAGRSYDVIGAALTMPPILFEKYFEAAEDVAAAALPRLEGPDGDGPPTRRVGARELRTGDGNHYVPERDRLVQYSQGRTWTPASFRRTGTYRVGVWAGGDQAGPEPVRMELRLDGNTLARFDVEATSAEPELHEVRARILAGEHTFGVAFLNDYYEPEDADPEQRDRNLALASIEWSGPFDVDLSTPFQRRFPSWDEDLRATVERVAHLLWRGRSDADAVDALLGLTSQETAPTERLRTALVGALVSPRFLFRLEPEPKRGSRPLDEFELATRLAAFLWSSVPDGLLLGTAASGRLSIPGVLHGEVDRLLRDARASRLASSFAGQWLQLRRLAEVTPDPKRFPEFSPNLRSAMRRESELFFDAVLREDRPATELLGSDFTFVNERLAKHYGMSGVDGPNLRRVPVPEHLSGRRGGILTQGAVLTATSNPTRTSPVLRGKWILEALLAQPAPPPPAGTPPLDESPEAASSGSLRERLARHREDASCAACHASMDAYGLALENYGATGTWRDAHGGAPVDARVELEGVEFEGATGLRETLLEGRRFQRGLMRHLATFALGRGLDDTDHRTLDENVDSLGAEATLREMIHAIVDLNAFRTRTSATEPR